MTESGRDPSPDSGSALIDAIADDVADLIRELAAARFAMAEQGRARQSSERAAILALIEISDAFDRVLHNVEAKRDTITDQMRIWVGNFKAVRRVVERHLGEAGATRLPDDTTFDPSRHTIVETVEDAARNDGDIAETVKPGYARAGEMLRKTEVRVVRNAN